MRRLAPALLLLGLAACSAAEEPSEEQIANQAESLERAANATTDQLIRQIDADAAAERISAGNAAAPANASDAQ